ncbi:MarR family transcriptional regulator [soil metagenome]
MPLNLDVEYQLTRLVKHTRTRTMQFLPRIHESLDYGSYMILLAIYESSPRDGVRASDLAEILGVHKSTVSRTISTLERLGLVNRVPDPSDGRAHLLALAPETRNELETIKLERHAYLTETLEAWPESDLSEFARLLGELNEGFDVRSRR